MNGDFLNNGLQFPFYQNTDTEPNLDNLKSAMLSKVSAETRKIEGLILIEKFQLLTTYV